MSVHPIDIIKATIPSTWATLIVSGISYFVIIYMNHGEYIGILLFITCGLLLLLFKPKWFGQEYYDNIYLVAKAKLSHHN